jgi:hypothetical protein
MKTAIIRGESIAACCCASLLDRAGVLFSREKVSRPKLPAVMIGDTSQRVLADIFAQPDLFKGLPLIRKRVVKWGATAQALALPHSAIVASDQILLDRIEPLLARVPYSSDAEPAEWTILSSRPLPEASEDFNFGSRMAAAVQVTLKKGADTEASWVESLPEGWLFMLPNGTTAWLLSVGGSTQSLLSESSLIAQQIAGVEAESRSFPCHPRIADPNCGPGWMACGSAVLGFDPLCGDGSGYAAREAILAAAVVQAASRGADRDNLIAHYRARLLAGFQRHLETCLEFYRTGHSGGWWDEQINATERGLEWCRAKRALASEFKFRLSGFSLEAIQK